jgi:hypothetical protein
MKITWNYLPSNIEEYVHIVAKKYDNSYVRIFIHKCTLPL